MGVKITDTTLRDAHQSLLATRMHACPVTLSEARGLGASMSHCSANAEILRSGASFSETRELVVAQNDRRHPGV